MYIVYNVRVCKSVCKGPCQWKWLFYECICIKREKRESTCLHYISYILLHFCLSRLLLFVRKYSKKSVCVCVYIYIYIQTLFLFYIYIYIYIYIAQSKSLWPLVFSPAKKQLSTFCCSVSKVKSSHLYLYSAFNYTNCNKALHSIKIGKLCQ